MSKTTNHLKTGIIGCGKVGHLHAIALQARPESHLAAVCDVDLPRAQAFAAKYGLKAYNNVHDMVTTEKLDVVTIGTPHPFHAQPAVQAVQAGAHCLIEKPLASSLQDCDTMINAAAAAGVKLGVICQRRFYAPCQRIRRAIDDGKIGKPILGTVHMLGWRDEAYYQSDPWRGSWKGEGGGVLVNQAPHQLDLLCWYMGPIAELQGQWANLNHPYIEVEDTAVATLRFANGGLGSIVVSNSQNPALYGKVMIHGQNGASLGVQTDGGAMFIAGMSPITEPPLNDCWTVPGEEHLLEEWRQEDTDGFKRINPMEHYHTLQVGDFLQAILDGREPTVTGQHGRAVVELFVAIYRSQRDHGPVTFPLQPENTADYDGRLKTT